MKYVLRQRATGRRLRAFESLEEGQATLDQWNTWPRDAYSLSEVDDDLVTNEFPHDSIPDSGGYNLAALMDDGGTLCEWCVRDPFNPVEADAEHFSFGTSTSAGLQGSGWRVVAFFTSGDCDEMVVCDHCGSVIAEGPDEEAP